MSYSPLPTYPEVTAPVASAPEGPKTLAVFMLENVLLPGSCESLLSEQRLASGQMPPREMLTKAGRFFSGKLSGRQAKEVREDISEYQGFSADALMEKGHKQFEDYLHRFIFPEMRAMVEAHRAQGHTLCLVSSAPRHCVEPFALNLEIDAVICSELAEEDGILTGEFDKDLSDHAVRIKGIKAFARKKKCKLNQAFVYGHRDDDEALLQSCAYPAVINPQQGLKRVAEQCGWELYEFSSRGRTTPLDIWRTSMMYSSMVGAAVASLPRYALAGDLKGARNFLMSSWGDWGSFFTGIKLDVRGRENLTSHRPAIFIFNHQSGVDVLVIAKLIRENFTGIGKQEIKRHPIVGPIFTYLGVVFIDRFNHGKAIEQVKPAVEALRSGLSLVIAPEGTRTVSKRINPFRKGAFHMAMQAGVPIVPIVLHNAMDAMPKHDQIIRPCKIYVDVLPPVKTDDWSVETIDQHVQDVRQLFIDTIGIEDDPEYRFAEQSKKTM